MEPFANQLESLMKGNKGFPQQLKQRLVHESTNVKNPFNFIVGLFNEGVLSDETSEQDSNFGLTVVFIVQLVMMMACSKGADAIGGLMKALEVSGNKELISALRTWVKDDFGVEADGHSRSTRIGDASVAHSGTKLIDNMMSHVKDELMGQLNAKPCNIEHFTEGVSNLAHQDNVLDEPKKEPEPASVEFPEVSTNLAHQNVQNEHKKASTTGPSSGLVHPQVLEKNAIPRTTGPRGQEVKKIKKIIKALCSKKVIGSLLLAIILLPILELSPLAVYIKTYIHLRTLEMLWIVCLIVTVLILTFKFTLWIGSLITALWRKIRPTAVTEPFAVSQSNSSPSTT